LELTINDSSRTWSLGAEAFYERAMGTTPHLTAMTPPETRQRVYYEIWKALRPLPAAAQDQL
jgi:hypothetical protein